MSSKEFEEFNAAMSTILRANPKAVKEAMELQKRENLQKRKAKKKPSARVSSAKG